MSDQSPKISVTRGSKRNGKRRKRSTGGRSFDVDLSGPMAVASGIIRGARMAWWAGLGVLSVAEDVGAQVFDALVEKGKTWKETQRERTEDRIQQLQSLARKERDVAQDLERRVRDEVRSILRSIDVPHRDDFEELHDQVDHLSNKIDRLGRAIEEDDESSF